MRIKRFCHFTLAGALAAWFLAAAPHCHAAPIEQAAADFQTLDGYVVQPSGDSFLIDLDAGDGVVRGDLFSVLGPQEKIVHPITKKVIGTLETVEGYLQVTRLMDGYSFARPLSGSAAVEPGDPIRRYERVPAVFWDYTGSGKPLANRLQAALSHLDWLDFETAQQNKPERPAEPLQSIDGLYFILTEEKLVVRGPDFTPLREYSVGSADPRQPRRRQPRRPRPIQRRRNTRRCSKAPERSTTFPKSPSWPTSSKPAAAGCWPEPTVPNSRFTNSARI